MTATSFDLSAIKSDVLSSAANFRQLIGLGSSATLNAGSANGVATLGADSKLTAAQIPDISLISYLGSVASQAAMLALSGQQGDWCVRSDLSTTWVITGSDPTLLANWTQLSYPSVPVQSVFGRTGNVVGVSTDYSSVGITNTAIGASNPSTGAFTTLSANSATLSTGTITASTPAIDITQTWNNAAVAFTGLKFNVTNTNSGSGSTLLDLLVDGSSKFKVDKDGNLANSSNTFQFGGADVASPVSQTLRVSSVLAGTSNANGADWTLQGSLPSGTGNTGKVVINNSFKGLSGNSTVTISIASPAVVTWTNHLSVPGQAIQFSTTGQLPTGITAGVTYYVMTTGLAGNHNQFQISAVGPLGPAVNTSGTQSGTHTGTWVTNVQNPSLPVALFGPSGIVGSGTQTPALELRQFWQHTSGTGRGLRIACCDTNSTGGNLLECVYGFDPSFSGSPGFRVDSANRTWCSAFIASGYVEAGSLGFFLRNDTQPYRWGGNDDVLLFRDAASILALRRANTAGPTTYPQAFRLYNTVDGTDAAPGSNWERAKIAWSSNVLQIGTEKLGTGSARALELQTDGTTRLTIGATGSFTIADALNISVGTTTGTKIGTGTTQKLGFYNSTPVVQPAAVADATDAASVITQLNLLLARMRDLGLIAT